jgi:hypothetical protein
VSPPILARLRGQIPRGAPLPPRRRAPVSGDVTVEAHVSTRTNSGAASRSGVASKHDALGTCTALRGRGAGMRFKIPLPLPPSYPSPEGEWIPLYSKYPENLTHCCVRFKSYSLSLALALISVAGLSR